MNGYVAQSAWNYYHLSADGTTTAVLSLVQAPGSGDADLYVKDGANPTRFDFDYFDISASQNVSLLIEDPSANVWYVGVFGWQATNYTISWDYESQCECSPQGHGSCPGNTTQCECDPGYGGNDCTSQVTTLANPQIPALNGTVAASNWTYYTFTFSNSTLAVFTLREVATTGYVWLYASQEQVPTSLEHDYVSKQSGTAVQEITVQLDELYQGPYYVGVYGSPFIVGRGVSYALTAWSPMNF